MRIVILEISCKLRDGDLTSSGRIFYDGDTPGAITIPLDQAQRLSVGRSYAMSRSDSTYSFTPVDEVITERIQKRWDGRRIETAAKKNTLLEMAREGAARPSRETPLGAALAWYICESGASYDAEFAAQIRELAPREGHPNDWWSRGRRRKS